MSQASFRSREYVRVEHSPSVQPFETFQREDSSVAKETPKEHFKPLEISAMLATWILLVIAVITICHPGVAWTLGLVHQLQVLGLMLNLMSLCLKYLTPRLFMVAEGRFGASRLQNYDAILQSSAMITDSQLVWRVLLLVFTILPIGLSLAYKEFIGGSTDHEISRNGGFYGMTAPAGLSSSVTFKFGPVYMANATLPFLLATGSSNITTLQVPQAYGFNVLLLSNTSCAYLDAPMPEYLQRLQNQLQRKPQTDQNEDRSLKLTAKVHGTVTSYNDSVESYRNNRTFWDQFYGPLKLNQPNSLSDRTHTGDLQSGKLLALLNAVTNKTQANDNIDNSWSIISFILKETRNFKADFEANAMLFNTRRHVCEGTWLLRPDSVKLVQGSCNMSSKPDNSVFTNYALQFYQYYLSPLVEYLAPFSTDQVNQKEVYVSQNYWRTPLFTTVVAGMYWSRATALMGYDNPTVFNDMPQEVQNEIYYHIPDKLVSTKSTLRSDWKLYFIMAVFPVLVTIIFLANLILSFFSHIDGGNFGIVALLAGVQKESLKIFDGASFSGALQKPVFMQIRPLGSTRDAKGREVPQNEYLFSAKQTF